MKKIPAYLAALAFTAVSASALAEDFYLFGQIGKSDFDIDPTANTAWGDTTDTTYSLGLGYRFNDYFSAEGGYTDLGTVKGTYRNIPVSVDTTAFFLGVKGQLMVAEQVSLFARTGAARFKGKGKTAVGNSKETGTDPYLSFGAAYHFTPQLAADWQMTRYFVDDADIDTVNLGLTYNF